MLPTTTDGKLQSGVGMGLVSCVGKAAFGARKLFSPSDQPNAGQFFAGGGGAAPATLLKGPATATAAIASAAMSVYRCLSLMMQFLGCVWGSSGLAAGCRALPRGPRRGGVKL